MARSGCWVELHHRRAQADMFLESGKIGHSAAQSEHGHAVADGFFGARPMTPARTAPKTIDGYIDRFPPDVRAMLQLPCSALPVPFQSKAAPGPVPGPRKVV